MTVDDLVATLERLNEGYLITGSEEIKVIIKGGLKLVDISHIMVQEGIMYICIDPEWEAVMTTLGVKSD